MKKDVWDITDYGTNGYGIAHKDNKTYFIKNTIVGEKVVIDNAINKNNYCFGDVGQLLVESKNRVKPVCKYYNHCGGCQLQIVSYSEQLNYKTKLVENSLNKFVKNIDVKYCKGSVEYNYRNKANFTIVSQNGKIVVGYNKYGSNEVLDVDDCCILNRDIILVLNLFKQFLSRTTLKAYDSKTKIGELRHLVVRVVDKQVLACVVATKNISNELQAFTKLLQTPFNSFGLDLCINTNTKTILSNNILHIFGRDRLLVDKNGLIFNLNSGSFMQINDDIADTIYNDILSEIDAQEIVINCYSGAGLLSGLLSKKCQSCIGIEISKHATDMANILKQNNNLTNLTNICSKCEDVISTITNLNEKTVILDPARAGVDKIVLETLINNNVKKIIYLSCNPATLGRDLKILSSDYNIQSIQPYDMFPQTAHVETLVILNKRQN